MSKIILFEGIEVQYPVRKLEKESGVNPFETGSWKDTEFINLTNIMGDSPKFIPRTKAALVYDNNFLYGCFCVRDKYIIARATENMQHVWKDSCVELFFTPCEDISKGYYNLEMNCIGTIYMQHQITKGNGVLAIDNNDLNAIRIQTSINQSVPYEEMTEKEWHLIFAFPYNVMKKYHDGFITPEPGVKWRANFNKCADESQNPHWITWNKIDLPEPQFHRPDYFGELLFL